MYRGYKYRIYPTDEQRTLIEKHFGCARWVYNWALQEKTARYAEAGISVSVYELQAHLPELKRREETAWLGEVAAAALQSSLHNLDYAFTQFFSSSLPPERRRYPVFKSRYDPNQSYQLPQGTRVNFDTQRVSLIGFRNGIKGCFNRRFEGKVKTTTVSRTSTGKFYVSVLVDTPEVEPPLPVANELTSVGLDFGLKDLVVTSDGRRFPNPKALKRYLRRLRIQQRRYERTSKGSARRKRARARVAKVYERISDIRTNNLHQISSELTRKSQRVSTLCIEDLSVRELVADPRRSKALKRSIQDACWYTLRRQLEYKCRWYGLNLRMIGRFEPSSKTCSSCGHIHNGLTLADREWACVCGAIHDRDVNAARNIRAFAFREQNTLSPSLLSDDYRQARRKATPGEAPHVEPVKRECQVEAHVV